MTVRGSQDQSSTAGRSSRPWSSLAPGDRWATVATAAFGIAAALQYVVVLAIHGFLPGMVNDGPWSLLLEGDLECLDQMGTAALRGVCDRFSVPSGYHFLTSGPFIAVGWLLMRLPGVGSYEAYQVTSALFDAVALAGGFALVRALGASRWVALGAATAYLLSPSVIGMNSFGGTFTGFTLLPAYAYADLLVMRGVARLRGPALAAVIAGYGVLRVAALFLDGYSFVVASFVSVALWTPWLLRRALDGRRRLVGLGTLAGAPLFAYAIYRAYVPSVTDPAPLELFRSMGLDLVTLVRPSTVVWGADLLGVAQRETVLWGDGTNERFNYIGLLCVGLAAFGLWAARRRPQVLALAAAGAVALVLSFGPSLKIDDVRPARFDLAALTYDDYLMPAEAADVSLPWGGLFTALPGLEHMRAVYRWSVLTRLALIALAAVGVEALLRRRRRTLAIVLGCLALIELAPNAPALVDRNRALHEQRAAFAADVLPDLRAATREGERVFFRGPDGVATDYSVNSLAARSRVLAYNAGGDKNALQAAAAWPPEIGALTSPELTADVVAHALSTGALDALVLPTFDLRMAAYRWPASPDEGERAAALLQPLAADGRLRVERRRWVSVVRLAQAP